MYSLSGFAPTGSSLLEKFLDLLENEGVALDRRAVVCFLVMNQDQVMSETIALNEHVA